MKKTAKDILTNWAIAQKAGANLPCPRCGSVEMREKMVENKLSRRESVYICSACGMDEAMEDMYASKNPQFVKMPTDIWFAVRQVFGQYDTPLLAADGRWEVTARKTIKVSAQDIDDIVGTAFDGGITYWCSNAEPVGEFLGKCASEQISRGGVVRLYDSESDDVYELTLEKMLRGIRLWIENEHDVYGVMDGDELDCCNVDADVADAMIQYALFGELVYG